MAKGTTISIRMAPKERYLLEMLARKQHRTITSVITWAISQAIDADDEADQIRNLWSTDPGTRLYLLYRYMPELMTFEEEELWVRIMREHNVWDRENDHVDPGAATEAYHRLIDKDSGG